MSKTLETHGPTLAAVERLAKARTTGDAGAIHKGEISLIEALRSYVQSTSEFNADGKDEAVIRLAGVILGALASSDVPFTSGSPFGTRGGKPLTKQLADPFGEDIDTMGVGAAVMKRAKAGLNVQHHFTRDVAQDVSTLEHAAGGRLMKRAAAPRKATSPNDPTGD